MISIKRFLDQRLNRPGPDQDIVEALTQMGRLLLESVAANAVRVRESDYRAFAGTVQGLARLLDDTQPAINLLTISSDAMEAMEAYCQLAHECLREEKEQMHSMVAMLTETVANLSGQTDASVARLQAIDKQLELASGLSDIRALRDNLETCLLAVREEAAQRRLKSTATEQRLREGIDLVRSRIADVARPARSNLEDIDLAPELAEDAMEIATSYVAAFKLQRAEHIANRFGDRVRGQMLAAIGKELKAVLGPKDKLLRWKGTSFVMFINTTAAAGEIKARLFGAVAATGQQYIEVGRKSALLAVGVDWILFPQSDHPSLEAALTEVDAFLANARTETSSPGIAMNGGMPCKVKAGA